MVDRIAAALSILVFLFLIVFWNNFTGAIPTQVPESIDGMVLIGSAIMGLGVFAKMSINR